MSAKAEPGAGTSKTEFVMSRLFDAPRELVYKAWTEPERMQQWFGPKGMTTTYCKLDLRPGGTYHYAMKTPDGHEMWGKWVFREVVAPERLVFVNSFSDKDGGLTRHPMNANWPLEMLSTVLFEAQGDKTLLTLKWQAINASEIERKTFDDNHASMNGGWTGTFERLTDYLAKAA